MFARLAFAELFLKRMLKPFAKLATVVVGSLLVVATGNAQVILGDNFNTTGSGSGFALGSGINSGINPPTTRLTGTAAAGLSYIHTGTKATTAYTITSNKLRVTSATNPGRFTFTTNGTTPLDLAYALGSGSATPANPKIYDITISIANSTPGVQRCSFALAATEGDATTWDFGIQVFKTAASDNFYTIGKRVDTAASGVAADINTFITNTAPGTSGTELSFLLRVTDAGAETTTFNSRVQVSIDNGATWIYDTATDSDLPNGWRFDGPGRYILWDVAPDAGNVTYDNFSVRPMPLGAALNSPANNAGGFGASANLKATVSNSVPGNVSVTFFGHEAAKPGPGPDFMIPVLPDTQNYAREAAGSGTATKEMWFSQTEWIITNRVSQNIPFVATLGDCVNNADVVSQWRNATNAMYRLESSSRTLLGDGIPYGITVGNHDQDPNGDLDGSTALYNQYFGTAHFNGKSYYGGNYDVNNDSWFDLFSAGGMDFLVFSFEFGRYGSFIMDWATSVLATNQNRRVIVLTHYAADDNSDVNATSTPFSTQGQAIYDALKSNPNFFLMMSGHVFNEGGEGRRADTFNGRTVRTLVSDYQGRFNGGNGLMRLMYFSPSNNLVSVKTFSPYTGVYETDANSQFTFSYNMQPNGAGSPGTAYVPIKTNTNVPPGSLTSCVWTGLQPTKTYEWYAVVTDASGNSFRTAPRKFNTGVNSAPIVSNMTVTVTGDRVTQLTFPAFDPNGDPVTFRTNNLPLRGYAYNFDTNSGTLSYLPTHGYRGLDRISYQANDSANDSGLGQLNLTIVAPPDTNANGLPDAWEAAYGITDPNGDADGDGQSNIAEYFANTNPTNAISTLKILDTQLLPNGNFSFTWASVGGTRYRVQAANSLTNGNFSDVIRSLNEEMDTNAYGTAATQAYTDTLSTPTNTSRLYRVKVTP